MNDDWYDVIADGHVWNLAFLNGTHLPEESPQSELRIVDFHDLFTVPRGFLEAIYSKRQSARLRLRPPYREHLSQAFARYFMRVGLPTPVDKSW